MVFRIRAMQAQASSSVSMPHTGAWWCAKTTLWLLLVLAAGCGQKGPLTLPGAAKSASAPASAASAAAAR
ncbi:MAG: lipoprotein [Burkholderiaceae bacterium]